MPARILLAIVAFAAACGGSDRTRCGITALAAPGLLLEEITRPGQALDSVTGDMPPLLPVRFAAGEARRGLVGRTDTSWVVGVEGDQPEGITPGFGVLVIDPAAGPQGVVIYEGPPIPGARVLGQVNTGSSTVPLIGLRAAVAGYQEPRCPLFPDSLRR